MAYENVRFNYNNFCIGAMVDTYCSIDTTNANASLQVKTNTGTTQANYNLNPTIIQDVSVNSLEYPGPRGTSAYTNYMPFWTLERDSDTQCTIKQWELNASLNRLDLVKTIVKSTGSGYYYNCYDMSLEYYQTSLSSAASVGDGVIQVSSTSNISTGDTLYLGLSTNPANMNAFEPVEVTSISGSYLYITATTSGIPPFNVYNSGNTVSFVKSIFLFSDASSTSGKGSLIKLDLDGNPLDKQDSGLYYGVRASSFGWAYPGTIGFIKGTNILYLRLSDYAIEKSASLINYRADKVTLIDVYDIALTATSLYRLQNRTMRRNDDGTKTDYTWTTYNFHQDGIIQYVDSVTMWSEPGVVANQENTSVKALVRNQYGNAMSGRTVYFSKTSGDSAGDYNDPNKQAITNSSGIATIGYTSGWYDPSIPDSCCEAVYLKCYTDGSNILTGSQYVWDATELTLYKKFIAYLVYLVQFINSFSASCYLWQILNTFSSYLYTQNLSKFQFPGGDWVGSSPPTGVTPLITQLRSFSSDGYLEEIDKDFDNVMPIQQWRDVTNNGQLSQTFISRHLSSGHQDTAEIAQFRFIIDALPAFWSEKNSLDTNIWIKLSPYGYSLNQSTLVFRVREVSYAGDTGWVNYAGTPYISVSTWDAGGGLLGLDITVNPPQDFHHNAMVYVFIEVYDTAPIPNIIVVDYWFRIIQDYKAPYITNENPYREEEGVAIDTNIEFDIMDLGVGVNIDSLEFFVNNRYKVPDVTPISGGYHIFFNPPEDFYYNQTVEISLRISDASDNNNILYDMWRFYTVESEGPWFDPESFVPKICSRGVYRKQNPVAFNVYEINNTGIDESSILVYIGGKERNVRLVPIIYRIS